MNRLAGAVIMTWLVACGGRASGDLSSQAPTGPPSVSAAAPAPPATAPVAGAPPGGGLLAAGPPVAPSPGAEDQLVALTHGWTVVSKAVGDLNQDGVTDAAAILSKEDGGETRATLKLWLADATGRLSPAIEAAKAVCAECGGAKGGPVPFEIAISDKRVLSIDYVGGSREIRSVTTKWRFQKGQFPMIGVVATDEDTLASEVGQIGGITREANLSTRKMTESVDVVSGPPAGNDAPPMKTTKSDCGVTGGTPDLATFDFEAYVPPACSTARIGKP